MVDTTKVLWAKKEATYGTDATPTAAANAVITRNFQTKPIVTDRIARNIDTGVRGRTKDGSSNARQTFSYELEAAGSGTADVAPAWMEHLEACGMAVPTITAATKVEQRFSSISTALSSLTAYHWHGNQRRTGLGARGTFGWDFTAGAYGFWKLDMTALLPAATPLSDAAPGAPTLARWKDPVEVNTANTDFLLDGFALNLKSFTGDVNADVKARNLVGANYIQRGNHGITGKIVGEAPLIASKNYFQTLLVGSEVAVQLIHGITAGNIVQLDSARLQITDIDLSEEDNVLMVSISYGLNVGATNDDLIITAK